MRQVVLSTQKGGISRLRDKGGASPETLFDLVDAYVTTAKTIKQRPGLPVELELVPGTVGFAAFDDDFYVFASTFVAQTDPRVICVVLKHPTNTALTLSKIHFAQTFLGRFYVVAEFSNGDIRHYWVTNAPAWTPETIFNYRQQIQPTVPNGFVYEVSNLDPTQAWIAGETIVLNDMRQPTVYSGFKFRAVAVTGAAPVKTSDTQPIWPITEGEQIVEYSYGGTNTPTTPPTPGPTYPPDIGGEYGPFPPGGAPRNDGPPINQV